MEIYDLDIKSFDHPWTPEEWQTIANAHDEYAISVVTYWGSIIGGIVLRDNGGTVDIKKVAVRKPHRRRGVSRLLIDAGVTYANDKSAREIRLILPESHVVHMGSDNLGHWAIKVGFEPTKPFLKNRFTFYGEPEDGVRFVRNLRKSA